MSDQRSGPAGVSTDPSDLSDPSELPDLPDISHLLISTPSQSGSATPRARNPTTSSEAENEELERFRREWQQDLSARRRDGQAHAARSDVGSSPESAKDTLPLSPGSRSVAAPVLAEQNIPREAGSVRSPLSLKGKLPANNAQTGTDGEEEADEGAAEAGQAAIVGPSRSPRVVSVPLAKESMSGKTESKDQAVQLYSRAVESEQGGKLNEALMLYRRAFKLDALAKQAPLVSAAPTSSPSSTDIVSSSAPADEPYSFQRHIQIHPDYAPRPPAHVAGAEPSRPSPLSTILARLPIPAEATEFIPAEESLPIPIARLPLELLEPILAHLDVASIERLAQTCWRARVVTARSAVWRRIVQGIYRPPAMVPEGDGWDVRALNERHAGEWRTTLIEEERVRTDGCYIAVCHYIRPGAGDQWVTITHMITYHRYLRFYPDGRVLSFLTTDHPSEVVPLLRPSLRGKGLHFGRWRLIRSDMDEATETRTTSALPSAPPLTTTSPAPAAGTGPDTGAAAATLPRPGPGNADRKRRARIVITDLLEPGLTLPKYEFEMELGLRETARGRWNKLDMMAYSSINLATGEALGLSLKHQKPFYFSKSYFPNL